MMRIKPETHFLEAQQAETLGRLEERAYHLLDSDIVFASADTIIYEHFDAMENAMVWLEHLHRLWLKVNMDLSTAANNSAYYRYIFLPFPAALENRARRKALVDFIILNVHLHLWHGVVCFIKFLDPRKHDLVRLTSELNFFVVPKAREFHGLPGYYRSPKIEQVRFLGSDYEFRQRLLRDWLFGSSSKAVCLFYDESHFGPKRVSKWHWKRLRSFFLQLYSGFAICPMCGDSEASALDHVGPISHEHYQTLMNFQLLCESCNRQKSNLELVPDPLALRSAIAPHLVTEELHQVLHNPPPWLGRIRRPNANERSIVKRLDLV